LNRMAVRCEQEHEGPHCSWSAKPKRTVPS
jgi:hypothetical protein